MRLPEHAFDKIRRQLGLPEVPAADHEKRPTSSAQAAPDARPADRRDPRWRLNADVPVARYGTIDGVLRTVALRDLSAVGVCIHTSQQLAVIQGGATGQIFQITKTRTTMGRSGADINLDDPEASRQHAMLEVIGDHAILRDLGSTNGTFVDLERIEQQVLNNHMEFRIGSHVLMFIVTEVE